jgi:hypothetical protein
MLGFTAQQPSVDVRIWVTSQIRRRSQEAQATQMTPRE